MADEIIKAEPITALQAAKHFIDSGLFPSCRNESQAFVKIQAGAEMGIGPFQAMRSVYVWEQRGQTCMQIGYQVVGACIKKSGRYNYRVLKHNEHGCHLQFLERISGQWEVAGESIFSEREAKEQGLLGKDNWRRMPKIMYFARALTQGANMYCPDVFGGAVYSEGDDFGGSDGNSQASIARPASSATAPPKPASGPVTLADRLQERALPEPAGTPPDPENGTGPERDEDVAEAVGRLRDALQRADLFADRQTVLYDTCKRLGFISGDTPAPISFRPLSSTLTAQQIDAIIESINAPEPDPNA